MHALNASLPTIFAGMKPVVQQTLHGREYFKFPNGQIRRQIGEGHSRLERKARRHIIRKRRNQVEAKPPVPVGKVAAWMLTRFFQSLSPASSSHES